MCYMSFVTCHMSCVTCHASHFTCHLHPITNVNSHSHRPSPADYPIINSRLVSDPKKKLSGTTNIDKFVVTFEPIMKCWCPSRFRILWTIPIPSILWEKKRPFGHNAKGSHTQKKSASVWNISKPPWPPPWIFGTLWGTFFKPYSIWTKVSQCLDFGHPPLCSLENV